MKIVRCKHHIGKFYGVSTTYENGTQSNGEVNISHENTTVVVWPYNGV